MNTPQRVALSLGMVVLIYVFLFGAYDVSHVHYPDGFWESVGDRTRSTQISVLNLARLRSESWFVVETVIMAIAVLRVSSTGRNRFCALLSGAGVILLLLVNSGARFVGYGSDNLLGIMNIAGFVCMISVLAAGKRLDGLA